MSRVSYLIRVNEFERTVRTAYGTRARHKGWKTVMKVPTLTEAVTEARKVARRSGLKRVEVKYRGEVVLDSHGKLVGPWLDRWRAERKGESWEA